MLDFRGKNSVWGKRRGKVKIAKLNPKLFSAKTSYIKEKARENAMFSLASLGAEERI